ncbi:MAG: hypothetical protein V4712_16615 [Pseudomonadota bacterium]
MKRFILMAAIVPGAALAQVSEDAMEMQRCIWRCQAEHGAGNAGYNACIAQYCEDGGGESFTPPVAAPPPPVQQQPALPAGPGVLAGIWAFGTHPALGPVAYITTSAGTVGLGCGKVGGYTLGLRFSNSFAAAGPVTLMTAPSLTAASYPRRQGDWSGADGDVCTLPVNDLAGGSALYILPAQIEALNAEGDGTRITLSGAGRTADVYTAAEALTAFGGYVVPLAGADRAIGALLQTCPRAQQDMQYGCGD